MAGRPKTRARRAGGEAKIKIRVRDWTREILQCEEYVPLGDEQIKAKLRRLRDAALDWVFELMASRTLDGTGCALHIYSTAAAELQRMDEKTAAAAGGAIRLIVNNLDLSRIAVGTNGPTGTPQVDA